MIDRLYDMIGQVDGVVFISGGHGVLTFLFYDETRDNYIRESAFRKWWGGGIHCRCSGY